jgi:hypothetical protein
MSQVASRSKKAPTGPCNNKTLLARRKRISAGLQGVMTDSIAMNEEKSLAFVLGQRLPNTTTDVEANGQANINFLKNTSKINKIIINNSYRTN